MSRKRSNRESRQPAVQSGAQRGSRAPLAFLILGLLWVLDYAAHHPLLLLLVLGVPTIYFGYQIYLGWQKFQASADPRRMTEADVIPEEETTW